MEQLLTVGEIGERIGLKTSTIYVMSSRGRLPEPDVVMNADRPRPTRLWYTSTIDEWNATRRNR
jgi:predicted DNA-binding transcriptional regulator AlpA